MIVVLTDQQKTFERQNWHKCHSLRCEQTIISVIFSDFPPITLSNLPLLSYLSVATPVLNNFHDHYMF